MTEEERIEELGHEVYQNLGKPVNVNVVRAMLESMSIRAVDAKNEYGIGDLQTLATTIYNQITSASFLRENPNPLEVSKEFRADKIDSLGYLKTKATYFLYHYPIGIFHGVPVFLQIATIILFGYSLWTYTGFNQLQSTAVVLGVIFGLIGTGGFVQVIGRQISHFWNNKDYYMAKRSAILVIRDGVIFLGILSVLGLIVNLFGDFYPYRFLFLVNAYAFSIGILLLMSAVFHPLKQRWMITFTFILATGVSVLLHLRTSLDTYYTHWIGIWTAIVIMWLYLVIFFNYKVKNTKEFNRATEKNASLVYRNYRYFLYGMLFFAFIFTDRFMAWSHSNDGNLPYIFFYEPRYEIGMDIAILVYFLLVGVLEFSVVSFNKLSDLRQKQIPSNHTELFNQLMIKMYTKHVIALVLVGLIIIFGLYELIWDRLGYERAFDSNLDNTGAYVGVLGGIGYVFVAWGMLNSLYLFTLNKPEKPLSALAIAWLVNLVVGLLFSRLVSYEFSVMGFLIGSIVFVILTYRSTIKFFRNLDYYYYAAY